MPHQHSFKSGPVNGKKNNRCYCKENINYDRPGKSSERIKETKYATGYGVYSKKQSGLEDRIPLVFGRCVRNSIYSVAAMPAKTASFVHSFTAAIAAGYLYIPGAKIIRKARIIQYSTPSSICQLPGLLLFP